MPRRAYSHLDRQLFERATAHYLRDCYRRRTAARVAEFAAYIGVTSEHLSRKATAILGMSLRKFLRSRQLAEAEKLLLRTNETVEQIALRCAFGTESTFYAYFKSVHGTSPTAFRRITK